MVLSVDDLIKLLRSSVNVQSPEDETIDPAYLTMTDDDLELFIKLGVSRAFPDIDDLNDLPEGSDYAIILLAKIELYTKLAVLKADKVDMGADNNNYLKQDQRFAHYMKLVQAAKDQYDDWLENEGQGTVSAYDVLLSNRHYSHRNYEKQVKPKVSLKIAEVTSDSISFSWGVKNTSHFGRFKVYMSKSPIVDMFKDGALYSDKICEGAKCLVSTSNIRNDHHRVENLLSGELYYIAVIEVERNQVFGYSEVSVVTLEELEDEEDVSDTTFEDNGGV